MTFNIEVQVNLITAITALTTAITSLVIAKNIKK
jgi:hypothetical protein